MQIQNFPLTSDSTNTDTNITSENVTCLSHETCNKNNTETGKEPVCSSDDTTESLTNNNCEDIKSPDNVQKSSIDYITKPKLPQSQPNNKPLTNSNNVNVRENVRRKTGFLFPLKRTQIPPEGK